MRHWTNLTTAQVEQIRALACSNKTIAQISAALNLPRSRIEYAVRRYRIKTRSSNQGVLPVPPWWWKGT